MNEIREVETDQANSHARKMEMRVAVARAIAVTQAPVWFKVFNRFMAAFAAGIIVVAITVSMDPDAAAQVRELGHWEIVKPCLLLIPFVVAVAYVLAWRRLLRDTRTTVGWWVKVLAWNWFGRTKTRPTSPKIKSLVGLVLLVALFPRQTPAQIPPLVVRGCIFVGGVAAGVAAIVWNCDDPKTYLVCQVDDRGRPVPGTWRCSPCTAKTLLATDERRAQGPFKKNDPLGCELRAAINNTNYGPTYIFDMSVIAETPKQRIKLERMWAETNGSPNLVSQAVMPSGDNPRFVQLSSWSLTNSLTRAELEHVIPELGVPLAVVLNEAREAGTLYQSDRPADFFRISIQPVVTEPPAAKATTGKLPER